MPHNAPPKAVIFDLDNTLVNTDAARKQAWADVVASFSTRLKGNDPKNVLEVIVDMGTSIWNTTKPTDESSVRREIVRRSFETLGISDVTLEREITHAFSERRQHVISLFPGALATLSALRDSDVRLALLSNSTGGVDAQRHKIGRFALAEHFEHIQIEGEFGVGKPNPAAFRNVLNVLALSPDDVWMVGDHLELDVAAAQDLGICGVWYDYIGAGLPDGHTVRPDHIITGIPEILTLLETDHDG